MKQKFNVLKSAVLLLLVVLLGVSVTFVYRYQQFEQAVDSLVVQPMAFDGLNDGVYQGAYSMDPFVQVQVEVGVTGGQVTSVAITHHENGRGTPAEGLVDLILKEQKLPVDTVSGATASSKVLMQAVKEALDQARAQ